MYSSILNHAIAHKWNVIHIYGDASFETKINTKLTQHCKCIYGYKIGHSMLYICLYKHSLTQLYVYIGKRTTGYT